MKNALFILTRKTELWDGKTFDDSDLIFVATLTLSVINAVLPADSMYIMKLALIMVETWFSK